MSKTTSIYARVEPEIKEQAESILNQLGIPMSNAINVFLRQIILQNGLPFELNLNRNAPLSYDDLSQEAFDREIEKGYRSYKEGKVLSSDLVAERLKSACDDEI